MSGLSTWYLPGKIMTHWNFPLMRPQKYKSSHIALFYYTSSALFMAEAAHQKPTPTKNPSEAFFLHPPKTHPTKNPPWQCSNAHRGCPPKTHSPRKPTYCKRYPTDFSPDFGLFFQNVSPLPFLKAP